MPAMFTTQMRSRGDGSYTAFALNEYTTGTPPNPTSSVKTSRKLRLAESTHDPFPALIGPSRMAPAPAKPSVAHPPNSLRLPSRWVTCSTLDVRLM